MQHMARACGIDTVYHYPTDTHMIKHTTCEGSTRNGTVISDNTVLKVPAWVFDAKLCLYVPVNSYCAKIRGSNFNSRNRSKVHMVLFTRIHQGLHES